MTCNRCGRCCLNAYISMENIKLNTPEGQDFKNWVSNYGLEIITTSQVPLIKFPYPCKYLKKITDKIYECSIYDTRPTICRNHWCVEQQIMELVRGNKCL